MKRARLARVVCAVFSMPFVAPAFGGSAQPPQLSGAEAELFGQVPQARVFHEASGRISRVYGAPLANGASALAAADRFRRERSLLFGVPADEIVPGTLLPDTRRRELPLMRDRATGDYRFTAVSYHQVKGGLPVEGSGM